MGSQYGIWIIAAVSSVQISGSSVIHGSTSFSLLNSSGPVSWSVTGPFSLSSSSGNPVIVSPTGVTGSGMLTASSGGTVTTKSITTPIITPPSYIECQSTGNVFTITHIPGAKSYTWYSGYYNYGADPNISLQSSSGNTGTFRTYYVSVWTQAWVSCKVTLSDNSEYWVTISVLIWPC